MSNLWVGSMLLAGSSRVQFQKASGKTSAGSTSRNSDWLEMFNLPYTPCVKAKQFGWGIFLLEQLMASSDTWVWLRSLSELDFCLDDSSRTVLYDLDLGSHITIDLPPQYCSRA